MAHNTLTKPAMSPTTQLTAATPASSNTEHESQTTAADNDSANNTITSFISPGTRPFSPPTTRTWRLIKRSEWQARPPKRITPFTGPIPYVILHHSYMPGLCLTEVACKAAMRSMQNFHMDEHGWPDIGYSFAIGGDGNVYEARGYNVAGAHAPNYNSRSIGLLLIGDFVDDLPPFPMIEVAKDFLKYSVEIGKLYEVYTLHGHRQILDTDCPGSALYEEIQNWEHWSAEIYSPYVFKESAEKNGAIRNFGLSTNNLPPANMLEVAKDFLKYSVEIGRLKENYILHGHRQVRATECPGTALYKEIQNWDHWTEEATDFYRPDKKHEEQK